MKTKVIGSLFALCFAVPILAILVSHHFEKKQIKREIKHKIIAGIDKNELVLLKLSSFDQKELKWKHSKEFEFKGEMYDIVETEFRNDSVYYYCWWDYEETKLNKELNQKLALALNGNQHNTENQDNFVTFYKSLFSPESETTFFLCVNPFKLDYFLFKNQYLSLLGSKPVPPPKLG